MKKHSNTQFAKALYEITKGLSGADLSATVKQFLVVLQKNNKLKKINYIIDEFIAYAKKQSGIKTIEVETREKLNPSIIEKIKKAFGEQSEITQTIHADMVGGIKIKVDDMVYDASLKTQCNRLKQSLIS